MTKIKLILISILLGYSFASAAEKDESFGVPIRDLILKYAELHETNFVVSAKVEGRVELFGVKVEKMSKSELIDILEYYNFIATRKDRIVYIFTRFEVEHLGKGIGPIWQG